MRISLIFGSLLSLLFLTGTALELQAQAARLSEGRDHRSCGVGPRPQRRERSNERAHAATAQRS